MMKANDPNVNQKYMYIYIRYTLPYGYYCNYHQSDKKQNMSMRKNILDGTTMRYY